MPQQISGTCVERRLDLLGGCFEPRLFRQRQCRRTWLHRAVNMGIASLNCHSRSPSYSLQSQPPAPGQPASQKRPPVSGPGLASRICCEPSEAHGTAPVHESGWLPRSVSGTEAPLFQIPSRAGFPMSCFDSVSAVCIDAKGLGVSKL